MSKNIKNDSSKPKARTRQVAGLAFFPTGPQRKKMGKDFWPSLMLWVEAKYPDNAYIFDSIDTLLACGIPVVDAKVFRGIWHRQVRPGPLKDSTVAIPLSLIVPVTPAIAVKTIKFIRAADPKEHHKMAYN